MEHQLITVERVTERDDIAGEEAAVVVKADLADLG